MNVLFKIAARHGMHSHFNEIPVGEHYLCINSIFFTFSSHCFPGEKPKNSLSAERLDTFEWR